MIFFFFFSFSFFSSEVEVNPVTVTHIKAIIQDFPERLVVISRPKKERFLMFPEGGNIQSSCLPEAKVVFPPNTLNTTTKVVLQVLLFNLLSAVQ